MRKLPALMIVILACFALQQAPALADQDPASSAETIQLSEALQLAIRQSPSLATARIDLDIAQGQIVQSLGIEDLLLRASGRYDLQSDESVAGDITGTNKSSQASGTASLSKLLPTGGTLSLHSTTTRRTVTLNFNDSELVDYKSQISARLDQPLLRGLGKDITRASQAQAKHNLSASQLTLRARARDEIQTILETYWELVWAHKELEIRLSALTLAKERRRLTESSVKLGSAPATAIWEVDQVMATSEEEILLAEQRITVRSLEFRRLSGMEIGPKHLNLTPAEEISVSPESFELAEVVSKALENDPSLAALAERKLGAEVAVAAAEDGTQARLDLSLSAGPLGTENDLSGSLTRMAKLKGYFIGTSLSFEQSLGRHTAKGRSQEARARRQLLTVSERDLRAAIATAAAGSVQSAHIASKRMELSRQAIDLSEKNIEAERRRFEAGKSTNFDVLERQEEQKQARLRYARAEVDYLRASIAIQALRGELLGAYGVTLDQ